MRLSRDERTTQTPRLETGELIRCRTYRITPRDDSFFPSHIKDSFNMNESFKNDPSLLVQNEMNENGMKHRVALHCCIKLIAHLCLRPRAHVLIYRKVHVCNEYKNVKTHTWVFFCFIAGIIRTF